MTQYAVTYFFYFGFNKLILLTTKLLTHKDINWRRVALHRIANRDGI